MFVSINKSGTQNSSGLFRYQGWHFDSQGNPTKMLFNGWAYQTPNGALEADRFLKRSTWVWKDRQWYQCEDHFEWQKLPDPHELFGEKMTVVATTFFKNWNWKSKERRDI